MPFSRQVFNNFPAGAFYVRHIDHPHRDGAASAKIRLILSELPPDGVDAASIIRNPGVPQVVSLNVGYLPFFAVGDVIRNKRLEFASEIGGETVSIFDRGGPAEVQTVVIDFDNNNFKEVSLWDEREWKPKGYPETYRNPEITKKHYGFPLTRASRFLRVLDGDVVFYFSASELLRSLTLSHSAIATELFRQPLSLALQHFFDLSSEPPDDSARLRIDLHRRLPARQLGLLVNLLPTSSPVAHASGARIFASLMADTLPDDVRRRMQAGRGIETLLPIMLPFASGRLSLKVKGARLDKSRFIVGKIVGGRPPPLRLIEAHLYEEVADKEVGSSGGTGTKPSADGDEDTATDEDPGSQDAGADADIERLRWEEGEDAVIIRRHRNVSEGKSGGKMRPGGSEGSAAGDAQPGGERKQLDGDHIAPPAAHRFDGLWRCRDRLLGGRTAPSILVFAPVIPPIDRRTRRGTSELDCWTCLPNPKWRPGNPGFHLLRSSGARRAVLVLEIRLGDGRSAHWFEIEVDEGEGFRSLVFAFRPGRADQGVASIIAELVAQRASIGKPESFASANYGLTAGTFHHAPIGGQPSWEFDDGKVFKLIDSVAQ